MQSLTPAQIKLLRESAANIQSVRIIDAIVAKQQRRKGVVQRQNEPHAQQRFRHRFLRKLN